MPRNGLITHIIAIIFIMMAVFVISSDAFGGSATLIWSSPLTNEDGTPLSDLAGYKIYYGTSSGNYTQNRKVDNVTTYTVTNLTDGLTYYFAVKAFDTSLNESAYSNEVFKKIPSSQQYALTVSNASGTGLGTVTSSPAGLSCGSDCSELYNAGTVVTLSALPDVSSTFSGWSGACTGTGSCSVTMNAAKSVNAVFNFKTYTITASAGAGGSISPSGSVFANYGVSRLFTITANSGYSISNVFVDGISVGALNSYTFSNITANHTISATFAQQQHTMTVTKSGTGTVTSSPAGISCGSDCSEPYNVGAVVTLSAAPYASSTFSGWSGACTGTAPCSVTMNAAKSVNASFLKDEEQTVQPLSTHLPQTGQTASYASGDDGNLQAGIEWPSPRFTDNRDGTITDTLTGLMWLKDAGCFRRSWNNSLQTVADLNANPGKYNCLDFSAKYSDWRMPNIRELESLVNFGTSNVASWLNANGFRKVKSSNYLSSTTVPSTSWKKYVWAVNMSYGTDTTTSTSTTSYLLPVRTSSVDNPYDLPKTGQTISYASGDDGSLQAGVDWPEPRFTDNKDGTVTDTLTGLMWLKDAGCLRNTWNSALQTVVDLNANPRKYTCQQYTAGYSDWRMPNVRELESLVNFGTSNIASWLNASGFLKAVSYPYWSSTTFTGATSRAWTVNMQNGTPTYSGKTSTYYIVPVRGGW